MADISFGLISLFHCRRQPTQTQCKRVARPKSMQLNFILAWKTPLWGLPLAPVDRIYTLFSEVRLSQMVPLQTHSSRTLTCIAVKEQETVNYTERHRDVHTDFLWFDTSLQMSLYFPLKTCLFINLTDRELNICVSVCAFECASIKTTSHFSLRWWAHINKKTPRKMRFDLHTTF